VKIIIVGAGKTGAALAHALVADHQVTIIDQRRDRIEYVRAMAPNVDTFVGDACELEVLETASIEGSDLVVAATGDDEDNLVVAMLAKHFRVGSVFARVNHPQNEWLFDKEWGVDVAVSSTAVLQGLIEKQIGLGDLTTLLKLQADGVSVEEITLPDDAKTVGKKLKDVPMPANVTVMAILARDGYVQAARGETNLVAGDQLLLLVEGELIESVIQDAFGIPSEEEKTDRPE
jgi:trk system potassium uptake protein TrkA